AGEENAFARGQPVDVVPGFRVVTQHESATIEIAPDGVNGPYDAGILHGQETDKRDQQQRAVESVGAVMLREYTALVIVTAGAHVGVNLVADPAPAVHVALQPKAFDGLDAAVHGNPGHHLRVSEVPARPADFPDALVGLL